MGIDLSASQLGGGNFQPSLKGCVKCARCSAKLGRPYPVEMMGLEAGESSGQVGSKYKAIIEVSCHGETMRIAQEMPRYWTDGMRNQALAFIYAFVMKNGVYTAEVRRGSRGQEPGILRSEVK